MQYFEGMLLCWLDMAYIPPDLKLERLAADSLVKIYPVTKYYLFIKTFMSCLSS